MTGMPPAHLDRLAAALASVVPGSWSVAPAGGSTGRTFIGRDGDTHLVLRLDAAAPVADRLASIGVAPSVVASGDVDGRPFVVMARVSGAAISASWVQEHTADVAVLVRRYLADEPLSALATPLVARDFALRLVHASRPFGWDDRAQAIVERYPAVADEIAVATHGDPNLTNWLVSDRPWLVDWDDLRRADPMRDVGQLAWWYLDESAWPSFTAACGLAADALERLHWWVAAESLDVAVRLAPSDRVAARAFIGDVDAALAGRPNPRRTGRDSRHGRNGVDVTG